MQESRLNRRHRWNQRLIRRALTEQRLVRSISMEAGDKIHIESSDWGDYWGGCAFPASLLGRLEHAWRALIGRLLEMSRRVLLEDADLMDFHVREHLSRFGLAHLLVRGLGDRHRMRGASVVMVERRD